MVPGFPQNTAPQPLTTVFTVLCAILMVFGFIRAYQLWRRDGNGIGLACMVSGTLGMLFEPVLDANGGVWYPVHDGWNVYTWLGVPIPLFVPLAYSWIYGGQGFLAWRAFDRSASAHQIWKMLALFFVVDVVIETIGVPLGVYGYYGKQPLNPWGLPMWYPVINSVGPLAVGALFFLLRSRLRGWKAPLMLTLGPLGTAMTYCGAGFPLWIALQEEWSMPAIYLCCAVTIVLAYVSVLFWFEATNTPSTSPLEPKPKSASPWKWLMDISMPEGNAK